MSHFPIAGAVLLAVTASTAYAQPSPAAPPAESHDAAMANAADAAAEAAAIAATPGAAHPADDVDLTELGLDASGGAIFDDKLNIYGFADMSWQRQWGGPNAITQQSFVSGKLNLYFAKAFTPKWRFLAEIRFMYAPNGSAADTGTAGPSTAPPTNTTVADTTDFNHPLTWGGIAIQRAYVDYALDTLLTIRAGHFLTPYGIWNVDHGSPAIISAYAPHIISEALFPEAQTGLELYGSALVGDYQVGYYATLSNGRSPVEPTQDLDHRVALGGRLEFEAPWAGTFKVGVSAYGGRATEIVTQAPPLPPGAPPDPTAPTVPYQWSYNEHDYAADVQWDHGGLHLQAEYIYHHRDPAGDIVTPSSQGTNQGYYVFAGYRFDRLWNVMPFSYYESWSPLGGAVNIKEINGGFNFRPTPAVVLKAMMSDVWGGSASPGPDLRIFTTQLTCVF